MFIVKYSAQILLTINKGKYYSSYRPTVRTLGFHPKDGGSIPPSLITTVLVRFDNYC